MSRDEVMSDAGDPTVLVMLPPRRGVGGASGSEVAVPVIVRSGRVWSHLLPVCVPSPASGRAGGCRHRDVDGLCAPRWNARVFARAFWRAAGVTPRPSKVRMELGR